MTETRRGEEAAFQLTRVLDAPRRLVWRAWAEAERLEAWFGPKGFSVEQCTLKLEAGGAFHYRLRGPDDAVLWGRWLYEALVPEERLVFVASFSDEAGGVVRAPASADWPLRLRTTVSLAAEGATTRVTLRAKPVDAAPAELAAFAQGHAQLEAGWRDTFARLQGYVTGGPGASGPDGERDIVLVRDVDAPKPLVYAAFVDPRWLPQWWGPKGFTVTTSAIEVRPGGTWRFVLHGPAGTNYDNRIVWRDLQVSERLTWEHDNGLDGDPNRFQVAVTLSEVGRRTRVTLRSTFTSKARRDAAVANCAVALGLTTLDKLAAAIAREGLPTPKEVEVSRVLPTTPALAFEAWTKKEPLERWWGPRGFSLTTCEAEVRPGGAYRFSMRDGAGAEYPFHGVYLEVVPQERLVFSAVIPGIPGVLCTTVTFEPEGQGTRVTVQQTVPAAPEPARGQTQGWVESLEKLAAALSR